MYMMVCKSTLIHISICIYMVVCSWMLLCYNLYISKFRSTYYEYFSHVELEMRFTTYHLANSQVLLLRIILGSGPLITSNFSVTWTILSVAVCLWLLFIAYTSLLLHSFSGHLNQAETLKRFCLCTLYHKLSSISIYTNSIQNKTR